MKKFLTFVLVLAMVMSVSSFAMAAEKIVNTAADLIEFLDGDGTNDAADGDTIKLNGDITLTTRVDVKKQLTLDLNGCSISGNFSDIYGMIYIGTAGNLTIQATNGGAITNSGGHAIGNFGTVTINGGTITGDYALYNFNDDSAGTAYGTAVINGGTFNPISGGFYSICNAGDLTIGGNAVVNGWMNSSAKLAINGGQLENVYIADPTTYSPDAGESASVTGGTIESIYNDSSHIGFISGGKFTNAPDASWVADGKAAVNVGNGTTGAPYTIEAAKTSGSITIAPASLDFGTVQAGYAQPEAKAISVQNITGGDFVELTVSDGYEISSAVDGTYGASVRLGADGNAYVRPKKDLGAKEYNGSVTIGVGQGSDEPTMDNDNKVALSFKVETSTPSTPTNPSSGGGYYGPNVWYIGGNTFGTNTNQVPTSVEIDGVPVSFTMNGSQITVGCIQPGSGWVTIRWGSVSNYRSFTPDANAYCTQTVIPKTGGMSIWAAIAQFLGF